MGYHVASQLAAQLYALCLCLNYFAQETVKNNSFSKHDNRHSVENFGIYLGGGLGRRQLADPQKDQHRSDGKVFTQGEGNQQKFISTYASGYRLKFMQEGGQRRCSSAMDASTTRKEKEHVNTYLIGSTKETFHRFPRKYSLPKDKESARPSVNAIWWHGSSPEGSGLSQRRDSLTECKMKGENQRCPSALCVSTSRQQSRKGVTWKD